MQENGIQPSCRFAVAGPKSHEIRECDQGRDRLYGRGDSRMGDGQKGQRIRGGDGGDGEIGEMEHRKKQPRSNRGKVEMMASMGGICHNGRPACRQKVKGGKEKQRRSTY